MSTNDRDEFARLNEECRRSSTCQLHRSHGGTCDARPESGEIERRERGIA